MADIVFMDALTGICNRDIDLFLGFNIVGNDRNALTVRCVLFCVVQKDYEDLLDSVRVTHNRGKFAEVILDGELYSRFLHDRLEPDLDIGDQCIDVEREHLKCERS